jgi:hypothetical protein
MPWNIRFIGRFGNGALAVIFGLFAVFGFEEYPVVSLLFAACAMLGAFNVYVLTKAARVISEDEAMLAAAQQSGRHPCGGALDAKPSPKTPPD